jgi:nucleoporin NUP159
MAFNFGGAGNALMGGTAGGGVGGLVQGKDLEVIQTEVGLRSLPSYC